MRKINFTKMVASGNDFVVAEVKNLTIFARRICDRKYGIGADGLLILEKSRSADVKMRIFNADGSEAEMCGNGARCVALWVNAERKNRRGEILKIETKAGIIESEVHGNNVKIRLMNPKAIKLDIPIKVINRNLKVNIINTGVPHAVIFVEGLDEIYINEIGSAIRYHKKFAPGGTNVDFVEVLGRNLIAIRTYERGVEDETLACGTGSVASALIFALKNDMDNKINVQTKSGEVLKVYFKKNKDKFSDVFLEGKAGIVYKGVYYV